MSRIVMPAERPIGNPPLRPAGNSSFARNSLFGTIAGVSTAVGSVLGGIIVARSLGVEGTGVVAFALLLVMVGSTVTDLGVQSTLARYLPELTAAGAERDADCLVTFLLWVVAVPSSVGLIGFLAYAAWEWRVALASPEQGAIWAVVGAAMMLRTLAGFAQGFLRGMQRFDQLARVTAISFAVQLVGIALGSMSFGVAGALAGYCLGSAVPAALCFRHFRRVGRPPIKIRMRVRRYAFYSWAGSLTAAFVWSRAEVFFLQSSFGSAAVGLFSIGITLANVASQGPMLLTSALLPHFAQSYGNGSRVEIEKTYAAVTRVLAFLVFPLCFGSAALLPAVLPFLYGQAFSEAVPAATILVLVSAFGSTASVGGSLLMAMDRSDLIFFGGAASAVLMVAGGFTVIPAFGLIGAAWLRGAIQLLMVAFTAWFIVARLQISLPFGELARIIAAAALCGLTARACLGLIAGAAALPIAVIAGMALYLTSIRIMHALPASDLDWLRRASRGLPAWSHPAIDLGFRLLARRPVAAMARPPQIASQEPTPGTSAAVLAKIGASDNAN